MRRQMQHAGAIRGAHGSFGRLRLVHGDFLRPGYQRRNEGQFLRRAG